MTERTAVRPGSSARCPHCLRPEADAGPLTEDHVFPEFLGGRATVAACSDCNHGLGHGLEGGLAGPKGLLTPAAQLYGKSKGELLAEAEHGRVRLNLGSGEPEVLQSVDVRQEDGRLTVDAAGTEQQMRELLRGLRRKHGDQVPEFDDLPEQARARVSVADVQVTLVGSLTGLRRLSAKVALCAGARALGDAYTTSALADWLRLVLDAPRDWPGDRQQAPRPDPQEPLDRAPTGDAAGLLKGVEQSLALFPAQEPFPALATDPKVNQAVLIPLAGGRVAVVVSVGGMTLPVLIAPAPLPDRELPVIVREPAGSPLQVLDVEQWLLDQMAPGLDEVE